MLYVKGFGCNYMPILKRWKGLEVRWLPSCNVILRTAFFFVYVYVHSLASYPIFFLLLDVDWMKEKKNWEKFHGSVFLDEGEQKITENQVFVSL